MEVLKLTSIRLPKAYLEEASKISKGIKYYYTSDVLRIAIWVGLKIMKPGVLHQLQSMVWKEETGLKSYTLEDVLRTAGVIKDDEHGAGL